MGMRLELAARLVTEAPDRAAHILMAERETARRAADELRYLVRRLRAAPQADLAEALRTQIAAMADRWPFDLEVTAASELPRLAPAAPCPCRAALPVLAPRRCTGRVTLWRAVVNCRCLTAAQSVPRPGRNRTRVPRHSGGTHT